MTAGPGAGRGLAARLLAAAALALAAPAAAGAAVIGAEPPDRVLVVQDHSEVLCAWYEAGVRGLPLIHIDAHPDWYSAQLRIERPVEEVREALEAGSCAELAPRVGYWARGDALYGIADFVYPAFRLGVVREVWWVVPARRRMPQAAFEPFRRWLRDRWQFPDDFLAALRYDGAVVRGTFRGLPVRLVTLDDLPSLSEPVLLDVDVDYLVSLYRDEGRDGMLDVLSWFFRALAGKGLRSDFVTVARSVDRMYTPQRFAYLADRVREFVQEPDRVWPRPPEAWRLQDEVERLEASGALEAALARADALASLEPASAVPLYDRVRLLRARGEGDSALRALRRAVALDPSYRYGYFELATDLYAGGRREESLAVLEEGWGGAPDRLDLGLVLAESYRERGALARSEEVCRTLVRLHPAVAAPYARLAIVLRQAGRGAEAAEAMHRFFALALPGETTDLARAEWEAPERARPTP